MLSEPVRHFADAEVKIGFRERSYSGQIWKKASQEISHFLLLKDGLKLNDAIGKYSKGNRLHEELGMEISMVFEGSGEDSKEMDLSEVLQVMQEGEVSVQKP